MQGATQGEKRVDSCQGFVYFSKYKLALALPTKVLIKVYDELYIVIWY